MSSSSPHNILQRRKNAKSKSKHHNNHQQHDRDQLMNSAAVNAAGLGNERLQSDRESNKHHQQTATIAALNIIQTRAHSLCNGSLITPLIDCCRDVNCYLNATACHPYSSSCTVRDNHSPAKDSTNSSRSVSSSRSTPDLETKAASIENSSETSSRTTTTISTSNSTTNLIASTLTKELLQNGKTTAASQSPPSTSSPSPSSSVSASAPASASSFTLADNDQSYMLKVHLDLYTWFLFALAFATRFYKITYPRNVVFDELHYVKSVAHYMTNQFFFDTHPPLGKQLIAAVADSVGYKGNFTAANIGSPYSSEFPLFWMRLVPALCGSLLPSAVYSLLKEVGISRRFALLGGLLVIFDNSLLIQSRFILMESMLLLFCTLGIYFLLKFQKTKFLHITWVVYGLASAAFLTFAFSVKYVGFFTYCLAGYLIVKYLWDLLFDATKSNFHISLQTIAQCIMFCTVPLIIYLSIFYLHLNTLYKAGPHDSVLTSAFQASLEGGLASITKNQPLKIAHGSQITLRHSHGSLCWLHSHPHVYPVRYPDGRGSSHQQHVTCYPFKDVNNWWIVKKPKYDDIVVGDKPEYIRHGDVIQLVHGLTSRALNSHDVAAPITPNCQEVSCYIDYGIKMKGELLWKVDIVNRQTEGSIWKTIKSEVRLIHVSTKAALKYSGRILPEWAFHQHEIVADRVTSGKDVIWNVEEHRYTRDSDRTERERQLLNAEMIPTEPTNLSFMHKFFELQFKMLAQNGAVQSHMYSSDPLEWPLLTKGIAYWVSTESNAQIHLLGNILIWYTCTLSVVIYFGFFIFYLLRRRRLCYDIEEKEWNRLLSVGHVYFMGYLMHYLPYFFMEGGLFLHHYMPAFLYKLQLLCFTIDHIEYLLRHYYSSSRWIVKSYRLAVLTWLVAVVGVYIYFLPISYGMKKLTLQDILSLRWKNTWDYVIYRYVESP